MGMSRQGGIHVSCNPRLRCTRRDDRGSSGLRDPRHLSPAPPQEVALYVPMLNAGRPRRAPGAQALGPSLRGRAEGELDGVRLADADDLTPAIAQLRLRDLNLDGRG